jgi:AmiR/NasT family two-component response regulator
MRNWWDTRVALVTEATEVVAAQTGCTPGEALAQLRVRAEAAESDLEEIATSILALQVLFDASPVSVA